MNSNEKPAEKAVDEIDVLMKSYIRLWEAYKKQREELKEKDEILEAKNASLANKDKDQERNSLIQEKALETPANDLTLAELI